MNPVAPITIRPAAPDDASRIAEIYNQGISERSATFETRHRSAADIDAWLAALNRPPPRRVPP